MSVIKDIESDLQNFTSLALNFYTDDKYNTKTSKEVERETENKYKSNRYRLNESALEPDES